MNTAFSIKDLWSSLEFQEEPQGTTDTVVKDRIMTVRVEPALYGLLESLTEKWSSPGVSHTVRTILSMYFLPAVYEHSWKEMKPEKLAQYIQEKKENGFSPGLARFNRFIEEVHSYLKFLKEAQERGAESLDYIENTFQKLESIVSEAEQKLKEAVIEL